MEPAYPAVSALELNAWLAWQLEHIDAWQAAVDASWLRIPTVNEGFPVLAALLDHALTPCNATATGSSARSRSHSSR